MWPVKIWVESVILCMNFWEFGGEYVEKKILFFEKGSEIDSKMVVGILKIHDEPYFGEGASEYIGDHLYIIGG